MCLCVMVRRRPRATPKPSWGASDGEKGRVRECEGLRFHPINVGKEDQVIPVCVCVCVCMCVCVCESPAPSDQCRQGGPGDTCVCVCVCVCVYV